MVYTMIYTMVYTIYMAVTVTLCSPAWLINQQSENNSESANSKHTKHDHIKANNENITLPTTPRLSNYVVISNIMAKLTALTA